VVWVDPKIAKKVALLPGVHAAVVAERDRVATIAEGLFAPHDNPGGHEITKTDKRIDALVNLDGPAPLSVEFGHWTPDHKRYVEGLHILGRAVAEAAL